MSEPGAPEVTVLIVNWNGQALLPDCLDALAKQDLDRDRWECWVIDNASTDDSLTLLAEHYPWVKVVRKNLGFAGGNNVGLEAVQTPFAALLNNDAHPEPDWLTHLLDATGDPNSADVAAWTSKVLFARDDGQAVLNNTGSILLPDGSGADRGYEQPDHGQYDQPEDVFLMSGTAVLLRTEALHHVGLFDPDFFMYYEDTDLSCELPDIGRRPVVVLSRNAAIPRLRRTLIAPCTTTIRGLPSEVQLEPGDDPIPRRSVVNLDSVESVSIATLTQRLGRLSDDRLRAICAALETAVDCTT